LEGLSGKDEFGKNGNIERIGRIGAFGGLPFCIVGFFSAAGVRFVILANVAVHVPP
jgi:hypothetical protein